MTSLRSRLAILLVTAIIGVVAVAALVAVQVLERPDRESFAATFAEEVRIVSAVLRADPSAAEALSIRVGPAPADDGAARIRTPRTISRLLAEQGLAIPVAVIGDVEARTRQIAFEFLPGQWAYLPYPGFPPRNWPPLVFYMTLVVIGAVAVSLFAATKMTRPLRILDDAVATIGRDGLPAHVPETGPGEMRAMARALNKLTARVREAVESRMRLVAAAGHDLRTPMTRMRLRAEFLPEEEREVWLRDLEELDRIADSAIRLVREEVDEASAEAVALDAMLGGIAEELSEIGRDVEVRDLPALTVTGRPLALKRALRNLVDNAAIHGGGARVTLARGAQGGTAVVTIEDDGPGIPEDLISRAFEPFFRVDPGRRKGKTGAGLGLAIAHEIIGQAGGSVVIENKAPEGLRQTVRLPLRMAAPAAA